MAGSTFAYAGAVPARTPAVVLGGSGLVGSRVLELWDRVPDASRYAAITDPGTALDKLATERGFARVFRNRADIFTPDRKDNVGCTATLASLSPSRP